MTRIPQFSVCQDCGQAWPLQLLDTDNNCLPGRCPQCAGQTCPACLENAASGVPGGRPVLVGLLTGTVVDACEGAFR